MVDELLADTAMQQKTTGLLHQQFFLAEMANEFNKLTFIQPNKRSSGSTEHRIELPDGSPTVLRHIGQHLLNQRRQMNAMRHGWLKPAFQQQRDHRRHLHRLQPEFVGE